MRKREVLAAQDHRQKQLGTWLYNILSQYLQNPIWPTQNLEETDHSGRKHLKLTILRLSLSTLPCRSRLQSKKKAIGHPIPCGILTSLCIYSISRSLTYPQMLGKRTQTAEKTLNWPLFLTLSNPLYQFRSKK